MVGVHLVGGVWGTLAVGLFATETAPAGVNSVFWGGDFEQLGKQAIGAGAVLIYSFVLTFIIAKAVDLTMGFRVTEEDEISGIDLAIHAESGYDLAGLGGGGSSYIATSGSHSKEGV